MQAGVRDAWHRPGVPRQREMSGRPTLQETRKDPLGARAKRCSQGPYTRGQSCLWHCSEMRCRSFARRLNDTTEGLTPLLVLSLRFDPGGSPPLFIKLPQAFSSVNAARYVRQPERLHLFYELAIRADSRSGPLRRGDLGCNI